MESWMSLTLNFIEEPSDFSNYVIHHDPIKGGKLVIGGYPFVTKDRRITHNDKLLAIGVDVWVNLIEFSKIKEFGSYEEYVTKRSKTKNTPKFLYCPIPDRSICQDRTLFEMIEVVHNLVRKGRFVYVHCLGGHGRSGVFACCSLMKYYG